MALYAWDAQVFSSGGSFHAGAGGDGADGGAAGSGNPGAAGGVGAFGAPCNNCLEIPEFGGCIQLEPGIGTGTQGGPGGSGRDGGPGGAGAGGYAYAVYRGGAAKLAIADDTVLEHGAAGLSSAGASGQAAPIGP